MSYEELSIDTLPKINIDLYRVNNKYKLYFLYKDNEIIYIGKSRNIISRINQHLMDFYKDFDSYSILNIEDDTYNIDKLEEFFIKKYTPKYNIQYNTLERYKSTGIDFPILLTNYNE